MSVYINHGSSTVMHNVGGVVRLICNDKILFDSRNDNNNNNQKKTWKELKIIADGEILTTISNKANESLNSHKIEIHVHADSIGDIQSNSGDIEIHDTKQLRSIKTVSGDVLFRGSLDQCDSVQTVSGDVVVNGDLSANSLDTMSGNIKAGKGIYSDNVSSIHDDTSRSQKRSRQH